MRKGHKWALTGALLAAAGAGAWLWYGPELGDRRTVEVRPPIEHPSLETAPGDSAEREPAADPPATAGTDTASDPAASARDVPRTRVDTAGDALASNSFSDWMDAAVESVLSAGPEDYRKNRGRAERGDAEAAFWLHWYFLMCTGSPRTDWQLEQRLAPIRERIDNADGPTSEAMAQDADQILTGYRLCSILEPELDARLAALEWLQVAADLGHHGALRMYHFQAKHLLTGSDSNLAFREPGRIAEFKARAADYAKALLETGHPQAYLLLAEMYFAGAAYPRDYVRSYAYALAANAFDGMETDTRISRNLVRQHLSPSQLREAERLADEILEQE